MTNYLVEEEETWQTYAFLSEKKEELAKMIQEKSGLINANQLQYQLPEPEIQEFMRQNSFFNKKAVCGFETSLNGGRFILANIHIPEFQPYHEKLKQILKEFYLNLNINRRCVDFSCLVC